MPWHPILEGALADAAWATVRETAAALAAQPDDATRSIDSALFWAYAAGALDEPGIHDRYEQAVEALFRRFAGAGAPPWLYGGSVGQAWVIAHISDAADDLADFDAALAARLADLPAYDLVAGVVGAGAYFLERARTDATTTAALDAVVATLAARAEHDADGGITWLTPVELLPDWQRASAPRGLYNLGVAHGVPGAIAVLAAIGTPAARALATGATRWLARHERLEDPRGRMPMWSAPDGEPSRTRTAWCYGDAGVATALWRAAIAQGGDPAPWETLARASAARAPALTAVGDPYLCHGAAGLAHLYNRCYQASGDAAFREAAVTWFERTLVMVRQDTTVRSADFLEGTAGIALALLAAIVDEEPGWDRLLLCDVPVR